MAPELRSIIRYMDDYIGSNDLGNAIDRGLQALKVYDEEREYDNSIAVLEKLVSVAKLQNDNVQVAKFVDYLKVRALLQRDNTKYNEIRNKYSNVPDTPLSTLIENSDGEDEKLVLETIERQNIFGDYSPLSVIPYLKFKHQDDAMKVVEDYFDEGRYIINLLDTTTSLHQAINLDVGKPEEVNIVERVHTYKLQ